MRRSLLVATFLFVMCVAGASAARSVGFYGCRAFVSKHPTPLVRPRSMVIACGDGNLYLTGIHWSAWTAAHASGSGTVHANDCKPNCAAGHFHTAPGTLLLVTPIVCKGAHVFSEAAVKSVLVNEDVRYGGC